MYTGGEKKSLKVPLVQMSYEGYTEYRLMRGWIKFKAEETSIYIVIIL